jgi:hypothetical protein
VSDLPIGFDIHGLRCWRSATDPSTVFYVPGDPSPERDPSGRPTLTLSVTDQGAMLQLGTLWAADGELLAELPELLVERFPDLDPVLVQLAPAPVTVDGVTLLLGDGMGGFTELKTARSSGFPPYSALFNVRLDAEEKVRVLAALNRRAGFLAVRYRMTLPIEVMASTAISGDVRADVVELGPDASLADSKRRVESALGAGRLALSRTATTGAPAELQARADRLAMEKAASVLLHLARQGAGEPVESALEAEATLKEPVSLPIERATDVGTWFPAGQGLDHVHVLTAPPGDRSVSPTGASGELVRLGFDREDAPIAFVQLSRGAAKATLRAPGFEPVTLSGDASGGPLVVRTHYTDGGPSFESTRQTPDAGGWVLGPEALGLARVVVDGSRLRAGGARAARVRVRYRPSGGGSADDRTVYLRDDRWTASWYVVTRSADLGGVLEFEVRETAADGSVVQHAAETTAEPLVQL